MPPRPSSDESEPEIRKKPATKKPATEESPDHKPLFGATDDEEEPDSEGAEGASGKGGKGETNTGNTGPKKRPAAKTPMKRPSKQGRTKAFAEEDFKTSVQWVF